MQKRPARLPAVSVPPPCMVLGGWQPLGRPVVHVGRDLEARWGPRAALAGRWSRAESPLRCTGSCMVAAGVWLSTGRRRSSQVCYKCPGFARLAGPGVTLQLWLMAPTAPRARDPLLPGQRLKMI